MTEMRVEHDALGAVDVPETALYGAHTARALGNTLASPPRVSDWPELLQGLAHVKATAALTNSELGVLDPSTAQAIVAAADEIVEGRWSDEFVLPLLQGGGGTSTNMMANEVIANRAAQLLGSREGRYDVVRPLDHVNRSQSTNDVYPTALQLAGLDLSERAVDALDEVARTLDQRAEAAGELERLGRTCLQDALAVPIAGYHFGQAHAIRRRADRLRSAMDTIQAVPLGATAVGTGFGAPRGYRERALGHLRDRTGRDLRPAADLFDALAHLDPLLDVVHAACGAAITLAKIAQDLRLLSSGPVGGIGEVELPVVQVGSSIMPGKVNPVIPELVIQASFGIRGSVSAVQAAVAAGELDLNVMGPLVARQLHQSLTELEGVSTLFARRCLADLRWNESRVLRHLAGSLEREVAEAMRIGHDAPNGATEATDGESASASAHRWPRAQEAPAE